LASVLSFALGIVHSVLGERLIFKALTVRDNTGENGTRQLTRQHVAVLRSTWHLVTLLGFGYGGTLLWLAWQGSMLAPYAAMLRIFAATFLISSAYWLVSTRGRHPAWIVLLIIGGLTLWSTLM
jgi:hypothetical protein